MKKHCTFEPLLESHLGVDEANDRLLDLFRTPSRPEQVPDDDRPVVYEPSVRNQDDAFGKLYLEPVEKCVNAFHPRKDILDELAVLVELAIALNKKRKDIKWFPEMDLQTRQWVKAELFVI